MDLVAKDVFTKEIINPKDLKEIENLEDKIKEVEKLIKTHPFSGRIIYLLENKEIGKIKVKNIQNIISEPNCIGTALFVAGVSKLGYPYHGCDFELSEHAKIRASNDLTPGVFNFSYSVKNDDWHAGIYLGKILNDKFFFSQNGRGGEFYVESIRCYSRPNYFIPSTLITPSQINLNN